MKGFTKHVDVLNRELASLERSVHRVGMKFGVLQRMTFDAGADIQGVDDALAEALKLISNAEDSLGIASAYISKFNQYYKSADVQEHWAGDDTSTTLSESESNSAFAEIVARVSDLEKRLRIRRIRRVRKI